MGLLYVQRDRPVMMQCVLTWLDCQPALSNKVSCLVAGDDVISPAIYNLALMSSLTLDHWHKSIGSTAEVHHCILIIQILAQHISCDLQVGALGEVSTIATVPADTTPQHLTHVHHGMCSQV